MMFCMKVWNISGCETSQHYAEGFKTFHMINDFAFTASSRLSHQTIQLPIGVVKLPPDTAYYSMVLPKKQRTGYFNGALGSVNNNNLQQLHFGR